MTSKRVRSMGTVWSMVFSTVASNEIQLIFAMLKLLHFYHNDPVGSLL